MSHHHGNSSLFGYQISHQGIKGDVAQAIELVASGRNGHYMACANPHSLVVASRDSVFRNSLNEADILVPDGAGIVLAAKVLKMPITERVAGYEFFCELTTQLARNGGGRYFFFGSSNHVLDLITQRLSKEFPEINVCGTLSPPFKAEFSDKENATMVAAINAARPDVLWVGMTAPKQEKWIHEHRDELHVPFCGAIGAVFDFYAGTKARSSGFWQTIGLEWFPRFLREPRRLWKRNMRSTPIFLWWIARERLRKMVNS